MATYDDGDGAYLRYRSLGAGSVQLKIEEDKTQDSETNHATEVVGYLAIEGSGTLTAQGQAAPAEVRKTYSFGGQRVAVRVNGTLSYLYADHLGSASLATNADGNVTAELRYYPYGETRWSTGMLATDRRFTGQREETGLELYDYVARRYDPRLGRFLQADTIVPDPANPQSLNRYAYVYNRPLIFYDPDGHFVLAVSLILLAAGSAFIVDWSVQVADNANQGMGFWDATSQQNVDLTQSACTAAMVGGATATVAVAAPLAVATIGQGLMGIGVATGSTGLWAAGTSTLAASAVVYDTLWRPSLPTLNQLDGGTLAHRQLMQEYADGVPAEQRGYVDLDQSYTNSVTGRRFRPDVANHWTGEVVEFKPQSWDDSGHLARQAEGQLRGYLTGLNSLYHDWRNYEGLPDYYGRVQYYDPLKYYMPE